MPKSFLDTGTPKLFTRARRALLLRKSRPSLLGGTVTDFLREAAAYEFANAFALLDLHAPRDLVL